ncbi:MAG: DNA primase [Spirochaetae bacterium HGW-Spirochaetae-5]|nr:MAG: DNA primase [Spirochaetae bacterium HGW-Spirochaetae-5]
MYLEKDIIEKVRESVRIEDLALRYIPSLKKKGRNYTGLCPFHKEKTPSFSISPDKQIFQCFGCNTGGNIFTFIAKIENIGFVESVKRIADIAGIVIDDKADESSAVIPAIRRINKYAMSFYQAYLSSGEGAAGKNYLKNRGVSEEAIASFKLGFSPDSWDRLSLNLKKNKADLELADKIGLIGKSQKYQGSYYDKFRNRVIFPIFDRSNNVIAFGGRAITSENQPKYLNSPESEVYQKRSILYGLNFAQNEIKELDRAIIVEGYLDVIGCHQNGITNVVAPLGTALTESHLKILSQICNEVIMLFDSDSAGINASLKSIETSKLFNIDIKIAILPQDDPFDFIIKKGVRELMAVIDSAEKPVDFKIRTVLEKNRGKDNIGILGELFEIIRNISNSDDPARSIESEKRLHLRVLSQTLNIQEEALIADYERFTKGERRDQTEKRKNAPAIPYETRAYRDLIHLLVHYPEITGDVLIDFSPDEITDPLANTIFSAISKLYNSENELRIDKIFDFFPKGLEMDFLNSAIQNEASVEDPKAAYTEIYVNLKLHNINKKITEYVEKVKKSGSDRLEYLAEIEILRREKEKLSSYIYNRGSIKNK